MGTLPTRPSKAPALRRRDVLPPALVLLACSCGGSTERENPGQASEAKACSAEPLVLGQTEAIDQDPRAFRPELQVVWTGKGFAVAWIGPAGYELRWLDGANVVASTTLESPVAETFSRPQLLWNSSRLELYYPRSEGAWIDVLDETFEIVESGSTLLPETGFRAVALDRERVALRSTLLLVVDGSLREVPALYGLQALGYNGDSFLASGVLGHGDWTFWGNDASGQPQDPVFDLRWYGNGGTGSAGGSFLASSYQSGRHAAVVATSNVLTVLVEGAPPVEKALIAKRADASMFWDGKDYVVLFADGSSAEGPRDIRMSFMSTDGVMVTPEDTAVLSAHSADERFPVGAAAGPGDYGIAWIRGRDVVFERCFGARSEPSP